MSYTRRFPPPRAALSLEFDAIPRERPRMSWTCGKPTVDGHPCRWHTPPCPHHPGDSPAVVRVARSTASPKRTPPAPDIRDAIESHNLHAVAWGLLGREVVSEQPNASLVSTLIRVLASLGPAPLDDERALAEAALRGVLMNGLAPRNADEWALAEEIFDEPTLADLRQREAIENRLRSHQ